VSSRRISPLCRQRTGHENRGHGRAAFVCHHPLLAPSSIESDGHAILEVGAAKHPVSVPDGASARGRAVRVADAIGRPSPTLVIREREHTGRRHLPTQGPCIASQKPQLDPFPSRKLLGLLLSLLADARSPTPAASLRPREPRTKPRGLGEAFPHGVRNREGLPHHPAGPAWLSRRAPTGSRIFRPDWCTWC
jgi:hypothetical protein